LKGHTILAVLAAVLGGVAGALGFLPYLLAGKKLRAKFIEDGAKKAGLMLLVPLVSLVLMIAALWVLLLLFPQHLMIVAVACVLVFLGGTMAIVIKQTRDYKAGR
jgi:hypothetical protein